MSCPGGMIPSFWTSFFSILEIFVAPEVVDQVSEKCIQWMNQKKQNLQWSSICKEASNNLLWRSAFEANVRPVVMPLADASRLQLVAAHFVSGVSRSWHRIRHVSELDQDLVLPRTQKLSSFFSVFLIKVSVRVTLEWENTVLKPSSCWDSPCLGSTHISRSDPLKIQKIPWRAGFY